MKKWHLYLETSLSGLIKCGSSSCLCGCSSGSLHSRIRHDSIGELLSSLVNGESSSTVQAVNFDESGYHSDESNGECDGRDEHDEGDWDAYTERVESINPSARIVRKPQSLNKSENAMEEENKEEDHEIE